MKPIDEQERKMLEEVVALSRSNNVMVRKLVSAQRRAALWRLVYWVIIIGASIVAYNSLQAYLSSLTGILNFK